MRPFRLLWLTLFLVCPARAEITLSYLIEAGTSEAVAAQHHWMLGGLGRYLLVVDVAVAGEPKRVASKYVSGGISAIEWVGDHAYMASGSGLLIYDVSDPLEPIKLGEESSASASDVAVVGGVAYVTRSTSGFRSVDVTDPSNPTVIGVGTAQGWPRGIRAAGTLAYVSGFMGDLAIMDVSNPAAPTQAGFLAIWADGWDLDVVGALAYVPGSAGLAIVDVSNPVAPEEIGRYVDTSLYFADCVAVVGNYAYLCDRAYTFAVIDVSDPGNPSLVAEMIDGVGANAITRRGDEVFTANVGSSFTIRGIANPEHPEVEGNLRRLSRGRAVALHNQALYAGTDASAALIDVHVPENPVFVGTAASYGAFSALDPHDARLYVGRSDPIFDGEFGGLSIFDISDPASPDELSYAFNLDSTYDVEATGSHAYLLGYYQGYKIRVHDVANEAMPSEVATINLPPAAENFNLSGNLLLVANQLNDLKVYDVTNPSTPSLRSTFSATEDARDVCVIGQTAFVADRAVGLIVVGISDPDNPIEIGRLLGIGQPDYIVAKSPYVVLCGADPLIRVVDVSSPQAPALVDSYQTGGSFELAVEGSMIATITRPDASVLLLDAPILNVASDAGPSLVPRVSVSAFPNPFNPSTSIVITIPSRRRVALEIFDPVGRRVRTIASGTLAPGTHAMNWDGHDSSGKRCASGVYFCRLRAGDDVLVRKLVLLK